VSRKVLLATFGIILLDQVSKFLASKLGFPIVFNRGIAFGLLPGFAWLMVLPLVLILMIVFRRRFPSKYSILHTTYPILFIIAGGISNLIDRLLFGAVRDWIHLPIVPVFNLADVVISLGSLILACNFLLRSQAKVAT